MKIAILSLVPHVNYGGILQSYALQTVLERMGHEVEILTKDIRVTRPIWYRYPFCLLKRFLKKVLFHDSTPILLERYKEKRIPYVSANTRRFVAKYLHTRKLSSLDDVSEGEYDAIVVGSDQVWRPKYFIGNWNSCLNNAFLAFADTWNIKRISYAASFGVAAWEYSESQTKDIAKYIGKFDAISVREESGVSLIREHFGLTACHVLDPTMLLSKVDYINLISENHYNSGNLFVYILDENQNKKDYVLNFISSKKMKPFYITTETDEVVPDVESWISGFSDAEYIITDSFHACVFSILFKKPFTLILNEKRGVERFKSLLNSFNIYPDFSQNDIFVFDKPIDVSKSLNRNFSIDYLERYLKC